MKSDFCNIPKLKLKMFRSDLESIPNYLLPIGYHFEFYQSSDCNAWIEIQMSAGVFNTFEEGLKVWNTYFQPWENELSRRLVFVVNQDGNKVAVACAHFDIHGLDPKESGRVHWVAAKKEFQGKKLSKPLVCFVLQQLKKLGYSCSYLSTQTTSWIACKVYLDLGFVPEDESYANEKEGWDVLQSLIHHQVLDKYKK